MAKLRVDKIAAPIVQDEFTGSVFFDGTGDYLSIPDSTDFDLGISNEPFTIEFWFYKNSAAGTHSELGILRGGGAAAWNGSNGHQYRAFQNTDNTLYWQWWNGSAQKEIVSTETPAINTWHHFAISYDGGTTRAFLNGVVFGTSTEAYGKPSASNITRIGQDPSDSVTTHGYHSNVRICKGHALYTKNFTPSTRELPVHKAPPKGFVFPAVDNVTVLLACQSSTDATLDSSGRHTITANGNAHAQSANPGLLRKTNIFSKYSEDTGSIYFDGTGDYLDIKENGNDFDFDGDFTIETWIYFDTINTNTWHDFLGSSNNSAYLGSNKSGWIAAYYTSDATGLQFRLSYQNDSAWIFELGWNYTAAAGNWYHVAYTRESGTIYCYINGVKLTRSTTSGTGSQSDAISSSEGFLRVGGGYGTTAKVLDGYISNLRICKGHAVYKSNFTPPTKELDVHPQSILLACYDGENIFADKTGRHIIAAYGDRLSSPTPTSTDSPIGITTFNPGLTRNVDPTDGPTFQGGVGYNSQNWLTLPKGTTTERNPKLSNAVSHGSARGIFGAIGVYPNSSVTIHYSTIATFGNTVDFGDLNESRRYAAGCSSKTRGLFGGGSEAAPGTARRNSIDYITIATTGNANDFGDLTEARWSPSAFSNATRGIWFSGNTTPANTNVIDYVTISTLGDALDFGDAFSARRYSLGSTSDSTRGIDAGGHPASDNVIQYVTIASTGNAQDFGDLMQGSDGGCGGVSNGTRGVFAGGYTPTQINTIQYITIQSMGNSKEFGDMTSTDARHGAAAESSTRGLFTHGGYPGRQNTIDAITIATTGNAVEFGDIIDIGGNDGGGDSGTQSGFSNGHGGLG